jgi:hypothetical protein
MRTVTLAAMILAALTATTGTAHATGTTPVEPSDLFVYETADSVTITNDAADGRQARFVVLSPDGSAAWDYYQHLDPGETWHQTGFDRCGMGWRVEIGHWFDHGAAFTGWMYEITRTGWFTCAVMVAPTPDDAREIVVDDTDMIRTVSAAEPVPAPVVVAVERFTIGGRVAE